MALAGLEPTSEKRPIRWRDAYIALKRLIADPERTEQVFEVIRALSGPSLSQGLARFRRLPAGARILAERRSLLQTLMDREGLAVLPPGSLGRAYFDFTRTEQISAEGLVDASTPEAERDLTPDEVLYGERLRDQHDLWHTLTRYGRDEFGELCLLAFTYAQTRNRGVGAIVLVGTFKMARALGAGVVPAVWRAYRDGKQALWLPGQDWEALLAEPLSAVRARLGIALPEKYLGMHKAPPIPA